MKTPARRVEDLEAVTGLEGTGCPDCRGKRVNRVRLGDGPPSQPVHCPRCGRDMLVEVHIVFVKAPEWRELWDGI